MGRETWLSNPWSTNQSFYKNELKIERLIKPASLFIYDISRNVEITLKLIPDDVSESYSPKITSVSPYGVIRPINFYVGGENKKVNMSFTINEDFIGKSLYDFLDRLKKMSVPVSGRNILKPPLVYFQLGEHFAGKGHINTSFDLQKPFRNGRYTVANCNIDFTFHEEFYDEPDFSFDEPDVMVSRFSATQDIVEGFSSYEDFISLSYSDEYFIERIYSNKKIKTFLNTIEEYLRSYTGPNPLQTSPILKDSVVEREMDTILSVAPLFTRATTPTWDPESYVAISTFYKNEFGIKLLNAITALRTTLVPIFSKATMMTNLRKIARDLNNLNNELGTSFLPEELKSQSSYINNYNQQQLNGIGWHETTDLPSGVYILMSIEEFQALKEAIGFILSIVDNFIIAFSSMSGAED